MSTYQEGSWQYAFEGGTVAFITQEDGTTVAKVSVTENTTAHSALPHNIRLMAAAPRLLAALHSIRLCEFNSMSSRQEMLRLAQEAIDYATGESK